MTLLMLHFGPDPAQAYFGDISTLYWGNLEGTEMCPRLHNSETIHGIEMKFGRK